MNTKNYIILFAIFSAAIQPLHCKHLTTFIPRSQGANTARELVGWQQQLYVPYKENYIAIASTTEYTRSFDLCTLAHRFFSTNRLTFAGSEREDRTEDDIIADYFGLATDFEGTLKIEPLIQNVIIDLNFYCGLNEWIPGLYVRVHAPITHTRWTLGLDPCIVCAPKWPGECIFPLCYMQSNPMMVTRSKPLCDEPCTNNSTLDPLDQNNSNCTARNLREALGGNFTFGDMKEAWKFGRFDFCPRSRTGLADIDAILGYNMVENDYGHFGIFLMTVVPTGNRPKAKFIFEPLVGNGRHWEFGGGLSGHISYNPNIRGIRFNMGLYAEGNITHMFPTDQIRSFDFVQNGLLSRYILLKEFDNDLMYTGHLINAINLATRNCEVSVSFKTDASIKFFVQSGGWQADIGYNIYYKDAECVRIKTDCPCSIDERHFGIKGLEGVCCNEYNLLDRLVVPGIIANKKLNTTQPEATMFDPNLPESAPVPQNVVTICFSWNSDPIEDFTPVTELQDFVIADTTTKPVLVTCKDLDPCSAAQGKMLTHKIFGHIGYTFHNSCYEPHVGIGAEAEFDGHHDNALKQWGTWLKWGFHF